MDKEEVIIILTIALVLITSFYAYQTYKLNIINESKNRPFIYFDNLSYGTYPNEQFGVPGYYVTFTNKGSSPAKIIYIEINDKNNKNRNNDKLFINKWIFPKESLTEGIIPQNYSVLDYKANIRISYKWGSEKYFTLGNFYYYNMTNTKTYGRNGKLLNDYKVGKNNIFTKTSEQII